MATLPDTSSLLVQFVLRTALEILERETRQSSLAHRLRVRYGDRALQVEAGINSAATASYRAAAAECGDWANTHLGCIRAHAAVMKDPNRIFPGTCCNGAKFPRVCWRHTTCQPARRKRRSGGRRSPPWPSPANRPSEARTSAAFSRRQPG